MLLSSDLLNEIFAFFNQASTFKLLKLLRTYFKFPQSKASALYLLIVEHEKRLLATIKYLNQSEAGAIAQDLFNEYGFSVDQLTELDGLSSAQAVHSFYEKGKVLVIAGPGNNGGDGLVCAKHLKTFGFTPSILYLNPEPSQNELMNRLVKQTTLMDIPYVESIPKDFDYSLIIDAIFGFSFKPPIREPFGNILKTVANSKVPVFSIDIPSGWDVDNGPSADESVPTLKPDALISLTAPKLCAKYFEGRAHFFGGRYVPPSLDRKYTLNLPVYEGYEGCTGFLRL